MSLHDRCPFITTSYLTWGRQDTVLRKCPLITGCPLIGVSLEDRFYCIVIYKDTSLRIQLNIKKCPLMEGLLKMASTSSCEM